MTNILGEISGDTRRSILQMISKKEITSTDISKNLKISFPGTQRHLVRLSSLGLIQKKPDYSISLTEKGRTVMDLLSGFDFLETRSDYLKNHTLSFLPVKFVKRIGELQNCRISKGFVKNIELYKKTILQTKQYVKHCTNVISLDTYRIAIPHFKKHNIKISFLLAKDMNLPSGWKQLQEEMGEDDLVQNGLMQRKMTDVLHVMMWVSEGECSLILPGHDGELDLKTMLVSSDDSFREWCSDYFDYLWNQSHGFVQDFVYEDNF